ncbi:hypothetical protein D3C76_84990 [compost metagenome]
MKKLLRSCGYVNCTIFMAALISWLIVLFIHGLIGTYAWFALKFVVPFLGLRTLQKRFLQF